MAAYNLWGNVGNAAYAVPMVKLTPFDPDTAQLLGWNPTEQAVDYLPFQVDPATGDVNTGGNLTLPATKVITINTSQVVGARRTGWVPPTGVGDKATFDPATVSLPQLAAKVKSLIDDLTAHGLIGA